MAGFVMAIGIDITEAAGCKLSQVAELPVHLIGNKLIVDGEINGQKIGIALDTGLTITLITRSAAERLELRRDRARGVRMFGIGGEVAVESALVDELKIGDATRKAWRMLVGGEHDFGNGIAVFLGEDFFHNADVEFDLAHAVVRLFESKDCDGVSLAYWEPARANEVEFDTGDSIRPQIRLYVQINGQPLRAVLDTGAAMSILDGPVARVLGVTPETPGVVAVGRGIGLGRKSVDYWAGPFKSFAIGDEIIRDPTLVFGNLFRDMTYTATGSLVPHKAIGSTAMLLGADFLRAHRVLVAHSQQKVYFTYVGGPVFLRMVPTPNAGVVLDAGTKPPAPER